MKTIYMEAIFTGVIALLTIFIFWQALFQNNIVLFKKRLELYNNYSANFHNFLNYAVDLNKNIKFYLDQAVPDDENQKEVLASKWDILNKFISLENAIEPMLFVGFSKKIQCSLLEVKKNANTTVDYFTSADKRKSDITHEQVRAAIEELEKTRNKNSDLNCLFQDELPLRNFKFYLNKLCKTICPCCRKK